MPGHVEISIKQQAAYRELSKLRLDGATREELSNLVFYVCGRYTPVWTK